MESNCVRLHEKNFAERRKRRENIAMKNRKKMPVESKIERHSIHNVELDAITPASEC